MIDPVRSPALVASGVARDFRSGFWLRTRRVLGPFDLAVEPGRAVGLMGPNGSGKSTFLRLAAGVDRRSPEMARFSRSAFLLSRQCGAAGAEQASHRLFQLARRTGAWQRRRRLEFIGYRLLAAALGWGRAARLTMGVRTRLPARTPPREEHDLR